MKSRKPPSSTQMERDVATFNAKIKPGDEVSVILDLGDVTTDKTTCEAYILNGHTPVVFLEKKGMYSLDRVRKQS